MLHELVFDVVLTPESTGNRALHEFSRDHPDFRRRLREMRYTRRSAWLVVHLEGRPSTLAAYERSFLTRPGYPARETRVLASKPAFRLFYERHEAPRRGEGETAWSLASRAIGTDASITFVTEGGFSRVTVQHEDRKKLRRYFDLVRGDDPSGEVRLVRIGPAGAPADAPDFDALDTAILQAAWGAGYYANPRRTTLRDLAAVMGIPFTTLGYRLRRMEAEGVSLLLHALGDRSAAPAPGRAVTAEAGGASPRTRATGTPPARPPRRRP